MMKLLEQYLTTSYMKHNYIFYLLYCIILKNMINSLFYYNATVDSVYDGDTINVQLIADLICL